MFSRLPHSQCHFISIQPTLFFSINHPDTSKSNPLPPQIKTACPKMPNPPTGDPKQHHPSKFADSISGSCLCGSITVTLNEQGLFDKPRGHLCHCANCRKVAGSYVASNLLMDETSVHIADRDGTLNVYDDYATLSGNKVERYFCSKDGKYVGASSSSYISFPDFAP